MNHLGDTNKMVSETPISDSTPHNVADLGMQIRRLERQLNAANERIKRLEEENNELRAEEARLLNTNGELERRIKRLIDAGDAMFPWSERVGQEFWNIAKEAKL